MTRRRDGRIDLRLVGADIPAAWVLAADRCRRDQGFDDSGQGMLRLFDWLLDHDHTDVAEFVASVALFRQLATLEGSREWSGDLGRGVSAMKRGLNDPKKFWPRAAAFRQAALDRVAQIRDVAEAHAAGHAPLSERIAAHRAGWYISNPHLIATAALRHWEAYRLFVYRGFLHELDTLESMYTQITGTRPAG